MRGFTYDQRRRFERIYGAEHLRFDSQPSVSGLIDTLDLNPDSVVVEFGAGRGHLTLSLATRLDSMKGEGVVFAYESSANLIEELDEAAEALGVAQRIRSWPLSKLEDITFLPLKRSTVDVVLSMNAAYNMADPLLLYCEFARILKPGGRVIMADWKNEAVARPQGDRPVSVDDVISDLAVAGLWPCERMTARGYDWVLRATKTFQGSTVPKA